MTFDTLTQTDTMCHIQTMHDLLPALDIDTAMPDAPFAELHRRIVDRPIDVVWPECFGVTVGEVRTLAPLLALRGLPRRVTRKSGEDAMRSDTPLLDSFAGAGFVILRRDAAPSAGHASVMCGAVGRFWSFTENMPVAFESPAEMLAFDDPGVRRDRRPARPSRSR